MCVQSEETPYVQLLQEHWLKPWMATVAGNTPIAPVYLLACPY